MCEESLVSPIVDEASKFQKQCSKEKVIMAVASLQLFKNKKRKNRKENCQMHILPCRIFICLFPIKMHEPHVGAFKVGF